MQEKVKKFVSGQISALTKSLDSGGSKARLAQLRRGIGKRPGELPELWGMFLQNMPEELMSKTDEPSYAEWAVYTALTLFALHQRGHSDPMHEPGEENRLGRAVRKLDGGNDEELDSLAQKFGLVAQSDDMTELSYRLKTVIGLLTGANIRLDYADLAADLYEFQFEDRADNIRLKWGRDFYRDFKNDDNGKEENDDEE